MINLLLFVLSISIAAISSEDYFKGATQKGLDYVRDLGVPFLEKEIKNLGIPDVKGTTNTPIGDVYFGLSSVIIKNISIPKSNMTIDQKAGLTVTCHDTHLELFSKWRYKEKSWPHIKDSGTVNIAMNKIQLEISFYIDSHNEKTPEVQTRKCKLDIGKLHLKFHGGASWLYNIFASTIAEDLKGIISKEVCKVGSHLADEVGDKILKKIPSVVQSIKKHFANFNGEINEEYFTE